MSERVFERANDRHGERVFERADDGAGERVVERADDGAGERVVEQGIGGRRSFAHRRPAGAPRIGVTTHGEVRP